MKTTGEEFFYSVSGLMLPQYMVRDDLEDILNRFVDFLPSNSEKIELYASNGLDREKFVDEMERLYVMLCDIRAHWLEVEAAKILRVVDVRDGAFCRSLLPTFLTRVRTLAVDIQLAKNKAAHTSYSKRGEIERNNDVVRSMGIIITLLESADSEKALEIARSVGELQDSDYIMPLISLISKKRLKDATALAVKVKEIYSKNVNDTINRTAKTDVRKKIVVVDDMPDILTAVSHILKEHYQVFPFSLGSAMLSAIDNNLKPDAFIFDLIMPEIDGFALAGKVRERAGFENTPIVFLTASSSIDNLYVSMYYEPSAFVVKPVNKDMIISKLSGFFSKSV